MTTLRRIRSWLPLLQRPTTRSCRRAAPATCTLRHVRAACPPQVRPLTLSAWGRLRNTEDFGGGRRTGFTGEEEDEDFMDDSEVEELFTQQVPAGIGEGQHRVFIVHPDVKWGSRKQHLTTGNNYIYSSTVLQYTILRYWHFTGTSCHFLLLLPSPDEQIILINYINLAASVVSYF